MIKNEIVMTRLLYILISTMLITLFIVSAESESRAALPVVLLESDEHLAELDSMYIDEEQMANVTLKDLHDRIVYIDPGHGGHDAGAVRGGYFEKDITLSIALMLYDMIIEGGTGIYPVLSRDSDVSMNRYDRADEGSLLADIFISIHCNDFTQENNSVQGIETYFDRNQILSPYTRINITSRELAQIIQHNVIEAAGGRDRGARDQNEYGYEFVVTTVATIPSVLVEVGFMSSSSERALLVSVDYQQKLALGIYNGILEVFGAN